MTQDDEQAIATGLAVALDVVKRIKKHSPQDVEWALPLMQEVSIELAGTWIVYDTAVETLSAATTGGDDVAVQ